MKKTPQCFIEMWQNFSKKSVLCQTLVIWAWVIINVDLCFGSVTLCCLLRHSYRQSPHVLKTCAFAYLECCSLLLINCRHFESSTTSNLLLQMWVKYWVFVLNCIHFCFKGYLFTRMIVVTQYIYHFPLTGTDLVFNFFIWFVFVNCTCFYSRKKQLYLYATRLIQRSQSNVEKLK